MKVELTHVNIYVMYNVFLHMYPRDYRRVKEGIFLLYAICLFSLISFVWFPTEKKKKNMNIF